MRLDKRLILFLCAIILATKLFSMDIHEQLFEACKTGTVDSVKDILENVANVDIKKQNDQGRTPILEACRWSNYPVVKHLLACGANTKLRDKKNQSLFSETYYKCGAYWYLSSSNIFLKHLLRHYTHADITQECKNMPLPDYVNPFLYYGTTLIDRSNVHEHVEKVLQGERTLESKEHFTYSTALHLACFYGHIPKIVELLKKGASLEVFNISNDTPYGIFTKHYAPFPLREACSENTLRLKKLTLPLVIEDIPIEVIRVLQSEIITFLDNDDKNSLHLGVNQDVRNLITYFLCTTSIDIDTPEAQLWKPVSIRACQLAGIHDVNSERCLTRILLWPQKKKTKINIKLALEDK